MADGKGYRHPFSIVVEWVARYCGVKPCSECPKQYICEDYDGGIIGMPEPLIT